MATQHHEQPFLDNTTRVGGSSLADKCAGRCDMELGDVTQHNVQQLKRLNQALFPVSYNDKFYKDVITAGELAKLAYFNDIVVGGVCCRVDVSEQHTKRMYIMTLGTLAPYRRFGMGKIMLDHVFTLCAKDPAIVSVFLHVQLNNETALSFYQRFGFQIVETVPSYYKRIEPADAYVLEKRLKGENATGPFPVATATAATNTSLEMVDVGEECDDDGEDHELVDPSVPSTSYATTADMQGLNLHDK